MRRSGGERPWATTWLGLAVIGRLDEGRARKIRDKFGRSHWLVSWESMPGGGWLARLSGPGQPETIEGPGRTRVDAIRRASRLARAAWLAEAGKP